MKSFLKKADFTVNCTTVRITKNTEVHNEYI